jgi:hypothetical protein
MILDIFFPTFFSRIFSSLIFFSLLKVSLSYLTLFTHAIMCFQTYFVKYTGAYVRLRRRIHSLRGPIDYACGHTLKLGIFYFLYPTFLTWFYEGLVSPYGIVSFLQTYTKNAQRLQTFKRFDRGNCNTWGLIVPKAKREGRQNRRKPAVPRTNLLRIKSAPGGN